MKIEKGNTTEWKTAKQNDFENASTNSNAIQKLFEDLQNGTSYLMKENINPEYAQDFMSKAVYTGINQIEMTQRLREQNKKSNYVISKGQIEFTPKGEKPLLPTKGTKGLGFINFRNPDAFYKKNDPEVLSGKEEVGGKKQGVYAMKGYMMFAAEDMRVAKMVQKEENGKKIVHADNVFSDNATYTEEKKIYNKYTDETYTVEPGDKVILSLKGSPVMTKDYVRPAEYIMSNEEMKEPQKPLFMSVEKQQNGFNRTKTSYEQVELAPLYKRKNDTAEEIFMEKMTEALRGKFQGNYEGLKISKEDLSKISELATKEKQSKVAGLLETASKRAIASKDVVAEIDKAVEKKNINTNTNTKENVNVHQKSKGRAK